MLDLKLAEKIILENLNEKWPIRIFTKECDLFYKGQIPTGAIYILEGKIGIVRRNKVSSYLKNQQILFLDELLNEKDLKNTIRVFPNTKIILVDRYSILEETLVSA